jgi:4-hydroxyphenylacetate 3-monooxygenase
MLALVDTCMSEYDLDGWTVPDMISPSDVNVVTQAQRNAANGHGA